MSKPRSCGRAALAVLISIACAGLAIAHPVQYTTLQVKVEPDGKFQAILNIDVLAFALDKTSQASTNQELQTLLDGPRAALGADLADADEHFKHEVVLRTDAGDAVVSSWTLPDLTTVKTVLALGLHPSILMPGEIYFSGALPPRAKTLAVRLPYVLGDTVHVFELPGGDTYDEQVLAGAYTTPFKITLRPPSLAQQLAAFAPTFTAGLKSMTLGGLDHVLFVLSFFLLSDRLAPIVWQILAFTAAHSLALWLAAYGLVHLAPSIIAPLIICSIGVLALANLATSQLTLLRVIAIAGFGFIHGLGFAAVFSPFPAPHPDLAPRLAAFHAGLEAGELCVVLVAFAALSWVRRRSWYRSRVAIPGSLLLAVTAGIWTAQRLWSAAA